MIATVRAVRLTCVIGGEPGPLVELPEPHAREGAPVSKVEADAVSLAKAMGWRTVKGKHVCPDCVLALASDALVTAGRKS